jgi:Spy/CpxP family protein refolding chaperone
MFSKIYSFIKNKSSIMKKVTLMFAIMLAFVANSFAQADVKAAATMEVAAGQKRESWKNLLGLTPEQDAKMKAIGKAYKESTEALKNDATSDKDQKKAKLADLRKANEADLKALLSADQFTKYGEIQKQRKEEKAKQGEKAPEKQ